MSTYLINSGLDITSALILAQLTICGCEERGHFSVPPNTYNTITYHSSQISTLDFIKCYTGDNLSVTIRFRPIEDPTAAPHYMGIINLSESIGLSGQDFLEVSANYIEVRFKTQKRPIVNYITTTTLPRAFPSSTCRMASGTCCKLNLSVI